MGTKAEEAFETAAMRMGYEVKHSNSYQDRIQHWDFSIRKKGKSLMVEVKAMKRVDSWDQDPQAEWIWIELHGVRKTDKGWLFGGNADLIAFEQSDHFIVVRRRALQMLVGELVEEKHVTKSSMAEYAIYSRPGREDELAMIRARDLFKIKYKIWRK